MFVEEYIDNVLLFRLTLVDCIPEIYTFISIVSKFFCFFFFKYVAKETPSKSKIIYNAASCYGGGLFCAGCCFVAACHEIQARGTSRERIIQPSTDVIRMFGIVELVQYNKQNIYLNTNHGTHITFSV